MGVFIEVRKVGLIGGRYVVYSMRSFLDEVPLVNRRNETATVNALQGVR